MPWQSYAWLPWRRQSVARLRQSYQLGHWLRCLDGVVIALARLRHSDQLHTGSHDLLGLPSRWQDYDDRVNLPRYVKEALEEGYKITHKGLICWCPTPSPSIRLSVSRMRQGAYCLLDSLLGHGFEDPRLPYATHVPLAY